MNNSGDDIFLLIERTLRQFRKFSQLELSKRNLDISEEQLSILQCLNSESGINQKKISEAVYKDPASVTRMIDILEKKDLVKRKSDSYDRRSYSIQLTQTGSDFIGQLIPLTKEMRKYGVKGIDEMDLNTALSVLKAICKNLE